MKSKYHDSLVQQLKNPSMVGGLNRFSPDAVMVALALCAGIRVKPANNRLVLNEIWETEYRQLISKPLIELRSEAYVDVPMVEEIARQVMTARSWAHKSSMYCSETVQSRLREIFNETTGSSDEECVFDIMSLTNDRSLTLTPDEREMALAAGRMAASVRDAKAKITEIPLPPTLRRTQIATVHAMVREIVEREAQWWEMIESFNFPGSTAAREFVFGVFTRDRYYVEETDQDEVEQEDARLNVVLDEAFSRLRNLHKEDRVAEPAPAISLEAIYGV